SSWGGYLQFQGCTLHFSAAFWAAFFGIKPEQLGWISAVPGLHSAFFSRILGRIFRNKTGAGGVDIRSSRAALCIVGPHFGPHFSDLNWSSWKRYLQVQGCTPH